MWRRSRQGLCGCTVTLQTQKCWHCFLLLSCTSITGFRLPINQGITTCGFVKLFATMTTSIMRCSLFTLMIFLLSITSQAEAAIMETTQFFTAKEGTLKFTLVQTSHAFSHPMDAKSGLPLQKPMLRTQFKSLDIYLQKMDMAMF